MSKLQKEAMILTKKSLSVLSSNSSDAVVLKKLLRCYRLTDLEKTVLLDLFTSIGEEGYAQCRHEDLASILGNNNIKSIQDVLKSLQKKRFITELDGETNPELNSYVIESFETNPYIIMSEFIHFYTDFTWNLCNSDMQYNQLCSAISDIVLEPTSNEAKQNDVYGKALECLAHNPKLKDNVFLYFQLDRNLKSHIEKRTNILIEDDFLWHLNKWLQTNTSKSRKEESVILDVTSWFLTDRPYVQPNLDEIDDLAKIMSTIPSPSYNLVPVGINFDGIGTEEAQMYCTEIIKITNHVLSLDESSLRREIEEVILKTPSYLFDTEAECAAFINKKKSGEDCWPDLLAIIKEPAYFLMIYWLTMLNFSYVFKKTSNESKSL